jgi:hypothetical protein
MQLLNLQCLNVDVIANRIDLKSRATTAGRVDYGTINLDIQRSIFGFDSLCSELLCEYKNKAVSTPGLAHLPV